MSLYISSLLDFYVLSLFIFWDAYLYVRVTSCRFLLVCYSFFLCAMSFFCVDFSEGLFFKEHPLDMF